jgi:hypothetical protein
MHQAGAFFVTRAKSNTKMRRVYSAPVDKSGGLICDQSIKLCGAKSLRAYPEHIRRVRFHDPIPDKTLVFLTNNTSLPARVITQLYKNRWQVELFFKLIKQHLRIEKFPGTSENAVKTQIWCAIAPPPKADGLPCERFQSCMQQPLPHWKIPPICCWYRAHYYSWHWFCSTSQWIWLTPPTWLRWVPRWGTAAFSAGSGTTLATRSAVYPCGL